MTQNKPYFKVYNNLSYAIINHKGMLFIRLILHILTKISKDACAIMFAKMSLRSIKTFKHSNIQRWTFNDDYETLMEKHSTSQN